MIVSGYVDVFFGVSGVVVKPDFFDKEAFNIPDDAWTVDDVWLSAQLARNNIPIYCPWRFPCPRSSEAENQDSLLDLEFQGNSRQESNRKAAEYCQNKYDIWLK
ncbi:MAG: glycosyltransferase family 2 protein, partial [Pseudomonadota bacterium]